MKILFRIGVLFLLLCGAAAQAALTIEITQGVEGALPIAVVPFGWSGNTGTAPVNVAAIISADLKRSGRFDPLPDRDLVAHPTDGTQVQLHNWRMVNVDNLVIGKVMQGTGKQYTVQFQLFDVIRGKQIAAYSFPADRLDLRRVAHHIADLIYEELTGVRGAFSTRVAYITTSGPVSKRNYTLVVADSDGYDPQTILTSKQPLMSPSWSPDGSQIAYVSFEKKTAEIYLQDVASGCAPQTGFFQGHQWRAPLVTGWPAPGADPVPRRQPGDLQHGREEWRIDPPDQQLGHRYRTGLVTGRQRYCVYLEPRRLAAAVPDVGGGRQGTPTDV